jgi:hypothetical protein
LCRTALNAARKQIDYATTLNQTQVVLDVSDVGQLHPHFQRLRANTQASGNLPKRIVPRRNLMHRIPV